MFVFLLRLKTKVKHNLQTRLRYILLKENETYVVTAKHAKQRDKSLVCESALRPKLVILIIYVNIFVTTFPQGTNET